MQQLKPWQIALFVAAVLALGYSAFSSIRGRGLDLANSIVMVDVETGELFSFPIGGKLGVGIPNFNPDSGNLSLLPVTREDGGPWILTERARPILEDLEVEQSAVVDASTGEMKTVGRPRRITQKAAPDA